MTDLSPLLALIAKSSLDAAFLSDNTSIKYFTGYHGFSSIERDAYLLVTKKNTYLFTSPLYAHEVRALTKNIQIKERTSAVPFSQQFSEIVQLEGLKTIGIEEDNLTVAEYQDLMRKNSIKLFPFSPRSLRITKTENETSYIQRACMIGSQALDHLRKEIKSGITELEVAFKLESFIRNAGASLSFPTIVAFGSNSATPHHHTDSTKLKSDDVILIDFGVLYENYCSDMTRTFFIGKPNEKQKKTYQVVLDSQQKAVEYIKKSLDNKTSIKTSAVDEIARKYILSQGYPSIPHSLGHGIGLEVHEAPSLSPNSTDILSEGMVFSIEPGIYLTEDFGVRIEDLYAIQDNTLIQLTHSPVAL